MTIAWPLLILSAFLHALWNALSKRGPSPQLQVLGILLFATFTSTLFSLATQFAHIPFFDGAAFPTAESWGWGMASGIFEGGYFITLTLALTFAPVGVAYIIMRGGAMLLVYFFSTSFLGEKISAITFSGIIVALIGLYFSSFNNQSARKIKTSYFWSYICAIFITGYHLCYSRALHFGANPSWLFTLSLWIAIPMLLFYSGRKQLFSFYEMARREPLGIGIGGLICTISFLLYLQGLKSSGAGMALVLRNTSILFAQVFAIMIGENVSKIQWLGAILVLIGATLVSLG